MITERLVAYKKFGINKKKWHKPNNSKKKPTAKGNKISQELQFAK